MHLVKLVVACAVVVVGTPKATAEAFVWLEGERPTAKNFNAATENGGRPEFLSGGAWLGINLDPGRVEKECPKDGIVLDYQFESPSAGKYEVWNRVGFEFVRSPFEWRIDEQPWRTVSPQELTTDLMEMGFWSEVAWLKLGDADLTAGPHMLHIRLTPQYKTENGKKVLDKITYYSDALCLYKGNFRPNGKHKPGADWQTADDRKAAENVFEVRAGADAGERVETPLGGLWQAARYDEQDIVDREGPTKALPDAAGAYWMSMPVPGNKFEVKPELRFCHRFVYRTRVQVPGAMAGRSFFLRFPALSMIASVHVNGRYCGWTKAPFARWECDVTPAIKAGQANEVCVVVKDAYYAISPKKAGKSCRLMFNTPLAWVGGQTWINQYFDFPVGTAEYGQTAGILETPVLVAAGGVYSSDVFVQSSVKKKQLGLEITLRNPGSADRNVSVANAVVPAAGGQAEKTFAAKEVTVPAGRELTVKLAEPWADPQLWWPDQPNLYRVVTSVEESGKPIDVRRTRFGFREWEWDGPQFKLNGIPWQLRADISVSDIGKDPMATLATWRRHGQNTWRLWGRHFGDLNPARALDLMDEQGMIVRRSGIFDGEGANYMHGLLDNKELFDNWIEQLKAQVREERNHPSILIWSLENEITFINSRNLGLSKQVEPEIARGARAIMAFDPTRPVMVDGGHCLIDHSLPVNGVHYGETFWRDYPDEAYTLAKCSVGHEKPVLPGWSMVPWQLMPDRPIFMGESFFARGSNPAAYAQFGGEGCFTGWGEDTRKGVGLLAKMLSEGYRWHGVAAYHFWMGDGETDLHYNSWQPVCVLCREWNWTFGGGSEVPRTLKVFNDTRFGDPIEMAWELLLEGKKVAGEAKAFPLEPGAHREVEINIPVPQVNKRTAGEFILTCRRGGKEVFREVKPVAILDANGGPRPTLEAEQLAVIDPTGSVKSRLKARGIAFTDIRGLKNVPAKAKVVVVGKDALTARDATDPGWLALAARGVRLLVLDQAQPLHFLALPADLVPTDYVGRIAFAENLDHPVFRGLDQPDFLTWSGDHVVYRNVYRKATRGAVSLAHCDEMLGSSAIAECPVNDGLMVLCQMVVGEKLGSDPVAQRLFDNLLAYCDQYRKVEKSTAVVMDESSPAFRLLADSGLKFDRAGDVLAAMADGKHQIVVFQATPANLKALAGAADQVKLFTARGGWLMAWGLTPEGLADFNKVVGVEHVLRPFELERVTLPAVRDPLLAGLTVRDVTLESTEQMFPWSGDKYLVDDEFSYVVDLEDVAPFCAFPGARAGDHAAARAAAASWPRNMVNGFTSADGWKLIYYMQFASPKIVLTLPREEVLDRFSIVLNTHYAKATKVHLYFDDDRKPVVLNTKPNNERQEFDLQPRRAKSLTIALAEFDKTDKVTGIDNVWIHVQRSADWHRKVKPLLNIGGLVKYPMGQGGLILNQVLAKPSEAQPVNAQKKQVITATLLRNLHAAFSGGKVLTTANLKFQPLPLNDQCNQYLTKDRGWFEGGRDVAHLPQGKQDFAGVTYVLRDFRTSPVPGCVMLAGPGARGRLPQAVKGLKAECTADALFFLHTFNRTAEWRPGKPEDVPPVVFKYVVHYADGKTVEVPVSYGEGVDHWAVKEPKGLKDASLAWAASFPGDPSGEQAALYQLQWRNPRPGIEIRTIDLEYGPEGSRYGTPALLGISAGLGVKY